jgi:type IV pilus assembly protein PilE
MRISTNRRTKRRPGFTLLEVMITVAIVGILASIALPMYFDQVTRSKIIDGTTRLGDYRSKMEKYFMDNRRYVKVAGGVACGVDDPTPGTSDAFTITIGPCTDTTYTITATGRPAYGMSSSFVYQVNQTNAKSSAGPGGTFTAATCWALRKDGSC